MDDFLGLDLNLVVEIGEALDGVLADNDFLVKRLEPFAQDLDRFWGLLSGFRIFALILLDPVLQRRDLALLWVC